MSRRTLDDEDRRTQVVIGWDPPAQSFFARVWVYSRQHEEVAKGVEPSDADVVFWTGGGDCTWSTPAELDALIETVQPYGCPHDKVRLRREPLEDKAKDDERLYDLY